MIIDVHSPNTGTVVIRTSTENKKVQIGSAIYQSGLTLMMMAAAITPALCTISPRMWITAALILRFSSLFPISLSNTVTFGCSSSSFFTSGSIFPPISFLLRSPSSSIGDNS